MRYWDSDEMEIPPRVPAPGRGGFLKFLLMVLGVLVVLRRPGLAVWGALARGFARLRGIFF